VQRVGHQVGKIPKAADTGQIARSQKWSKRDKMEFLRLLMRWGLPLVQGRSKVRWQFFTEKSTTVSLKKRSDASLEACYRDIYREMKQILDHPDSQLELAAEKPNLKVKQSILYFDNLDLYEMVLSISFFLLYWLVMFRGIIWCSVHSGKAR
jgi:hypothetical protein